MEARKTHLWRHGVTEYGTVFTMRGAVVLGASGLVGQRLQQRLANHPMFSLRAVAGPATVA